MKCCRDGGVDNGVDGDDEGDDDFDKCRIFCEMGTAQMNMHSMTEHRNLDSTMLVFTLSRTFG